MKKSSTWFLVVTLAFVLANSAFASDVIKIGHSVSLTGGASIWGQSEARALDMLVKKLNAMMREGKYTKEVFKQLTGKTETELDDEWRATLGK